MFPSIFHFGLTSLHFEIHEVICDMWHKINLDTVVQSFQLVTDFLNFYCIPSFLVCCVFSPSYPFHIDTYCCLCTNMLSEVLLFLSQYLTLCGDIQLMLAQNANNRAAHLEEFNYQTKEDQEILHSLHRESSCQGMPVRLIVWFRKMPEMLVFRYCCFVSFLNVKLNMILCICV